MRSIAEHIVKAHDAGCDLVLVTVVGGKGSAPRHAGSQMLVGTAGLACGTIGGGALERHAIAQARTLLGAAEGRFEHWDLEAGLGMACGGEANVLYTPVRAADASWRRLAADVLRHLDARIPANLALRCSEDGRPFKGAAVLLGADGGFVAGDRGAHVAGTEGWFTLPLPIPVRAVVFGAGHVGRATSAALLRVGFSCTVFDSRSDFSAPRAFLPHARRCAVAIATSPHLWPLTRAISSSS